MVAFIGESAACASLDITVPCEHSLHSMLYGSWQLTPEGINAKLLAAEASRQSKEKQSANMLAPIRSALTDTQPLCAAAGILGRGDEKSQVIGW